MTKLSGISLALLMVALGCDSVPVRAPESHSYLMNEPARFLNLKADTYYASVAAAFGTQYELGSCFSMVSLEDDQLEQMVTVQCSAEESDEPSTVSRMVAEESIANRLHESGYEVARTISVRREECFISAEQSRKLRDLWLRVLRSPRVQPTQRIVETRREYFFSSYDRGLFGPRISAFANSPPGGSLASDFVSLGMLLAQSVSASPQGACALSEPRFHALVHNIERRLSSHGTH